MSCRDRELDISDLGHTEIEGCSILNSHSSIVDLLCLRENAFLEEAQKWTAT
jgi:hypothetical protein